MSRIIFDIETAGRDFASLDEPTQQYLLKYAETQEEVREVKESLSFYPVTAEIVAIGMLNPDTGKGPDVSGTATRAAVLFGPAFGGSVLRDQSRSARSGSMVPSGSEVIRPARIAL